MITEGDKAKLKTAMSQFDILFQEASNLQKRKELSHTRKSVKINPIGSDLASGCPVYRFLVLGVTASTGEFVDQILAAKCIDVDGTVTTDNGCRTSVTVDVDGQRSDLRFLLEDSYTASDVSALLSCYHPQAILVSYSLSDKRSFWKARNILQTVFSSEVIRKPVISLVASKPNRSQMKAFLTKEGRMLSEDSGCRFLELAGMGQKSENLDTMLEDMVKDVRRIAKKRLSVDDVLQCGRIRRGAEGQRTKIKRRLSTTDRWKQLIHNAVTRQLTV